MTRLCGFSHSLLFRIAALATYALTCHQANAQNPDLTRQDSVLETLAGITQANLSVLQSNREQIMGVELMVASPAQAKSYSRFGHAMLRFTNSSGNWLEDLVLSFEASVDEEKLNKWKGLTGGYPLVPVLEPFHEFWSRYVRGEFRSLARYPLALSRTEREALIDDLVSWSKDSQKTGNYTFLNNNCARALSRLMGDATLESWTGPRVPTQLPQFFKERLFAFWPKLEVEPFLPAYEKATAALEITPIDFAKGRNWPGDSALRLESALSDLEIKRILHEHLLMPTSVRQALTVKHRFGKGSNATLEDVLGFALVPVELYQVCGTSSCAKVQKLAAEKLWTSEALKLNDMHIVGRYRFLTAPESSKTRSVLSPERLSHLKLLADLAIEQNRSREESR